MRIQFSSLDQAPRTLPIWRTILDDLGNPGTKRISKTLGVSERTVYRWNQTGHVPKMANLALFWLTRWGRSQVDAQAINDARLGVSYARVLHEELVRVRAQLVALQIRGAGGSPPVEGLSGPQAENGGPVRANPKTPSGGDLPPPPGIVAALGDPSFWVVFRALQDSPGLVSDTSNASLGRDCKGPTGDRGGSTGRMAGTGSDRPGSPGRGP